jgi:hypothetical protein
MIFNFFDYIYYRTYSAYKNLDDMPSLYALALISLMQQFNVFIVLFTINTFFNLELEHVNTYVIYASFFVFIIPNYVRYTKFKSYKQLDEKWSNEAKNKKVLGSVAVILYIVLSTIVFIIGAHILGKIKRGEL